MANLNAKQFDVEWAWSDPRQRQKQINALIRLIENISHPKNDLRVSVVWTAGAGGFSSSREILDQEFAAFNDTCAIALKLSAKPWIIDCALHITSSAGGLFEGQCRVGLNTSPLPKRPYGESKLRQEKFIEALEGNVRKFVYRPSSVYGFAPNARKGLVATLIHNASLRESTKVFGSITTLRDFVYVEDIARFIASRIVFDHEPGTFTLASAKPTSLGEIIALVGRTLSKHLLIEIDPNPSNSSDNTFLPAILPHDFFATDLRTGIVLTKQQLVKGERLKN